MGHCIEPVLNSGQTWFKITDFGNFQNAASVHKKYKYKSIKQIHNVTQTFPVMHFDIWRIPHQLFDNHGDHGHDGDDIDDHHHCNHKGRYERFDRVIFSEKCILGLVIIIITVSSNHQHCHNHH